MDIGTAKPTPSERAIAPHHLLDLVEPNEPFTVDHWLPMAERTIEDIRSRGRFPILVGGTNLYIKAFMSGMMDGPAPDETLRESLEALDSKTLRERLLRADPIAADRIHANDRRRTIRALEVHHLTGVPISESQAQWDQPDVREDTLLVGLNYPADVINPRINARVRMMMDDGLLKEVANLHAKEKLGPQAIEALGYRQLVDHLEGKLELEEAIEQIKIRTRRFAKNQRTWLKRFQAHIEGCWIECPDGDTQSVVDKALKAVESHPLLTPFQGPKTDP
tara:strand:- start:1327 stop:2160 length:834 start_codon:yes stop_codon:yes gene_type:complete